MSQSVVVVVHGITCIMLWQVHVHVFINFSFFVLSNIIFIYYQVATKILKYRVMLHNSF